MQHLYPSFSSWLHCCELLLLLIPLFLLWGRMRKILLCSSWRSRVNIPPGSRGLPLIGETLQFMVSINSKKGFYDFVSARRLRYGKCFRTNIFRETHVFVSSTESAKAILNNDSRNFTKRYIRSIAELVGDQSLLCASHQQHKLICSRLINLFSVGSISSFTQQFDELIVNTLSGWDKRETVVILDQALKITLKAMCKMLISLESAEEMETLQKDVGCLCEAMLAFPLRFPLTRFYKGLQARRRIMKVLEKMISERRSGLVYRHDFLQQLMKKDDKDECPSLTDAQIQDNILTMIIAGQDTTASAMTWMVKYLDENQEVLHTVRAEQVRLAEKAPPMSFLTLENLNEMAFASKVVKESLRMASIVAWLPRLALEDCQLEGFIIKKGWTVNVDARSIHLDPTVFNDPWKFVPSRFDVEAKPYSFLAFGMGGRTCLGMNMAKAMMLVFLYRLSTTYNWKVIDSDSSIEKWAMFSRLRTGCPVTLTRINPSLG